MLSKKISVLLLIICVITSFLLIIVYSIFEDDVFHNSIEWGRKNDSYSDETFLKYNEDPDYYMSVESKSKGAFMAGRKIDVLIQLRTFDTTKINSSNHLVVVFPGSINYPIPKNLIDKSSDGYIKP